MKISLVTAYISLIKFDALCLSEFFCYRSILSDNSNIEISGYTLEIPDDPSTSKRGVIYIYYRSTTPLRVLDYHYLQECINFEV